MERKEERKEQKSVWILVYYFALVIIEINND